jgi:hypothetical protein
VFIFQLSKLHRLVQQKLDMEISCKHLGLYEVGTLGGLPGLGMRIMMNNFQMTGKKDNLNIELNVYVSKRVVFFFGGDVLEFYLLLSRAQEICWALTFVYLKFYLERHV